MKRTFFISATLLVFLLILAGCSQKNQGNSQNNGQNKSNKSSGATNMRRPDFGQPERSADARGIVKSIVGNEVDILIVDFGANRKSSSTPEEASTTRPATMGVGVSGGGPGGPGFVGGGPGGPSGLGERTGNGRAAMLEELKKMSTGEEKVIIPVGIRMLKFELNGAKREPVEATLSDITADKNITIWLNASSTDKKIAEFVLIN
ncbi:MAG: hypothetical protein WC523_06855 [Patescibacteria group bacterium]|jgi:hypothetical protein